MSFIDNNIIPILSGENLNMIVLNYKEEQYKKIISNSKRHRKYYIEKIEEITNETKKIKCRAIHYFSI